MNCKVTIFGAKDAESVNSLGDLSVKGDSFTLAYTMAGDKCLMSGNVTTISQSRRGSLNTDATFSKGKRTAFVLSGGELSGEIPLKTLFLEVSFEGGLKVKIDYELGGARINLRLSAKYI